MVSQVAVAKVRQAEDCGPPLLRNQLCFAVYAASHAFARRYKPLLQALQLTYPQFLCMMVLWEADDQTVGEIGGRLLLDSGTLTPLLKRLEGAGLVSRVRDRQDERQVRIRLTDKGRGLGAGAGAIPLEVGCDTGLQPEEIAALREQIIAVRDKLDQGATA